MITATRVEAAGANGSQHHQQPADLYPLAGLAQDVADEAAQLHHFLAAGGECDLSPSLRQDLARVLRATRAALRGAAHQVGRSGPCTVDGGR